MRRSLNPFVTNSYSNYAPADIGDTVEEQALLAQTQKQSFDQAVGNFDTSQNAINSIKAAPGKQYYVNSASRDFESQYDNAKEEGNFEDMVSKAGEVVEQVSDKYKLPTVIKERAQYEADLKAIDDSDNPLEWKEFQKKQIMDRNRNPQFDVEGNAIFTPYASHDDLAWQDVSKYVNTQISGWKADGVFDYNEETGKYDIKEDIIEGKAVLRKGTSISPSDIRAFAYDIVRTNPELNRSIQDQSKVAVESILMNQGTFTKEDLMALTEEDNPFQVGTPEHEQFAKEISTAFDRRVKRRLESPVKADPQQVVAETAIALKDLTLRNTYAGMMANKYGYLNEQLQSWDLPDEEDSSGSGSTVDLSGAVFGGGTVATSDTMLKNSKVLKDAAQESLNAAESEYSRLLLAKQKDDADVPDSVIETARLKVETMKQEMDNYAYSTKTNAAHVYAQLNEGKDYKNFQNSSYESYTNRAGKNVGTGISFGAAPTGGIRGKYFQEDYIKYVDSNATFPTEETLLTKEQFAALQDTTIVNELIDEDHSTTFTAAHGVTLRNLEDEDRGSLFKNYQTFNLSLKGASQKQKQPFLEYTQTMDVVSQTLLNNLDAYSTTEGETLTELFEDMEDVRKEGIEFNVLAQPVQGDLAFEVLIPSEDGKKGQTQRKIIQINEDDVNGKLIKDRMNQTMTNLSRTLLAQPNLQKDQEDMLASANSILNILDGSKERFDRIPLYTAPEGTMFDMEIGNSTYSFAPYQFGFEKQNRTLVMKRGVAANMGNSEGVQLGNVYSSRGVLGYHIKDTDPNTGEPLPGVTPQYFAYNTNPANSAFTLREDNSNQLELADWFVPANFGTPDAAFQRATLNEAKSTGTMNKGASSFETLIQQPELWMQENLDETFINSRTDELILKGYNKDNGYTPLNQIIPSKNIGVNVNQPFLALNGNEAVNRVSSLFADVEQATGLPLIVTGGGRDSHNVVAGGAENSIHKEYGALDLLKTPAAMYLTTLDDEQLIEYGIDPSSILTSYDDHIHIELLPKYLKSFNPVN